MNSENAYLWRLAVFVIYSTQIMREIIQMSRMGMENLDDNWDSEMIEIWSGIHEPLIFVSPEIG